MLSSGNHTGKTNEHHQFVIGKSNHLQMVGFNFPCLITRWTLFADPMSEWDALTCCIP